MPKQIFVNLPVRDLDRSVKFFTKMGFAFNKQFTNENATCMIISKNIFAMLLVEKFFRTFTKKPLSDAKKTTEVIIAIDAESRRAVDRIISAAVKAGGIEPRPTQDYGWMYGRSFEDLDGHILEVDYMGMKAMPKEMKDRS